MGTKRATVAQALVVVTGCVALAACDGNAHGGGSSPLVDGGPGIRRDAGGGSSGFGAADSGAGGRSPGTGGERPGGGAAGADSGPGASGGAGGAAEAGTGGTAHADSGAGGTAHADSGAGGTAHVDSGAGGTAHVDSGAGGQGTGAGGRFVCPASPCPAGKKLCQGPGAVVGFGACVDIDDPAFGCGPSTCTPCSVHGTATCSGGACAYTACAPHFDDCDGNPVNGCETDLLAHDTCGGCHTTCGASEKCDVTGCVAACPFPRSECNGSCRDLSTDPANCGGCDTACNQRAQSGVCSAGKCGCASTAEDCGYGCIDVASDPYHCGTCDQPCPGLPADPQPQGSEIVCEARTCGLYCYPGFTECSSVCTNLAADPNQCGSCGHACASGEICLNGACSVAATTRFLQGRSKPEDIVLDATSAYFTDLGDDTVWRVNKDGTGAKKLASSQAKPFRIAVDDTNVYWTSNLGGAVLVAPKDGSGTAAVFASSSKPSGISVDATKVYWVSDTDRSVHQQAKSGGTDTVLAALPDNNGVGIPFGNVVDMVGTSTAVVVCDGRNLASIDKATGTVDAHMPGFGGYFSPTLSLTGDLAYAFQRGYEVDVAVGSSGGALLTGDFLSAMVTDGCTFYLTNGLSLSRVPIGVANLERVTIAPTIFSSGTAIRRLALESDSLYWTATGYVGKVAR